MANRYEKPPSPPEWKKRNAFGLPPGSVRALLALAIAATVCGSLVLHPDREVPAYLRDLMFIILGHYFASRSRPRSEAHTEADTAVPPPLYLPKGTVRLLLVGAFVGVAVFLYGENRLGPIDTSPAAVTLLLIGGFLLGALFKALMPGDAFSKNPDAMRLVEDLKAFIALGAAAVLVVLTWDQASPFLPDDLRVVIPRLGSNGPEHLAAAWIGFYFGSR
ncbi:hypothetical protein [Tautonia marina]|uniref:hypothetical protein n=1 Tax=Tautonia marina TaxID=2653855 RepID=UPI001260A31F|nr:hypothetical protein [Tautonia marina]